MKILVINGSPKKEKSDTMHITRAFLDGMNEVSENEIHIIHATDKHIAYCTGCFACMHNGGSCIHDDDMRATECRRRSRRCSTAPCRSAAWRCTRSATVTSTSDRRISVTCAMS